MAKIKIFDLPNISDEVLLVNLTEYEQNKINGGDTENLIKDFIRFCVNFIKDNL